MKPQRRDCLLRTRTTQGGTIALKDLDYKSAARHYVDALALLEGANDVNTDEQKATVAALKLSLHLNLALTYSKLELHKKVVESATQALALDASNAKALFRRAAAHEKLADVDAAHADVLRAAQDDPLVRQLRERLEAKLAKRKANEKQLYSKMFG